VTDGKGEGKEGKRVRREVAEGEGGLDFGYLSRGLRVPSYATAGRVLVRGT